MTYCEPTYVGALDWLLCDALGRIARGEDGSCTYLRLSNRPLDQAPFEAARTRHGDRELRRLVLAGGYRLVEADSGNASQVYLVGCGAVLPEVVAAAGLLADRGMAVDVVGECQMVCVKPEPRLRSNTDSCLPTRDTR